MSEKDSLIGSKICETADLKTRVSDEVLAARLMGFKSRLAEVDGVRLHFVEGGQGRPLFLLSGWPQTWWAYHKILPALAKHYHVIAVDMRGQGSSQKTKDGYDKKTIAGDIANLAEHLGLKEISIAGHDIGAMVAFSFAANYPQRTTKVAMLDIAHPFEGFWQIPLLPQGTPPHNGHPWWFALNSISDLPEALLRGRHKILLNWVFDYLAKDKGAISDFDREVYAAAYEEAGASAAVTGWFQSFNQDIADLATYSPLRMPVLGLGGPIYPALEAFLTGRAENLRMVALDSGHWLCDEKPDDVFKTLSEFFA